MAPSQSGKFEGSNPSHLLSQPGGRPVRFDRSEERPSQSRLRPYRFPACGTDTTRVEPDSREGESCGDEDWHWPECADGWLIPPDLDAGPPRQAEADRRRTITPGAAGDYPSSWVRKSDEENLLWLMNGERAAAGLPQLTVDLRLQDLARAKAWDIIDNGYFAHHSPTHGSPWDHLREAQVPFVYAGENLATAGNVWVVHRRLMQSPGHQANILNRIYIHVGNGVLDGRPSGVVVAQIFVGR